MRSMSEGGAALVVAMPASKGLLDETARWKIARYLRSR